MHAFRSLERTKCVWGSLEKVEFFSMERIKEELEKGEMKFTEGFKVFLGKYLDEASSYT